MVAESATRVTAHTASHVNDRIRRETERNIEFYTAHPEFINLRLRELDEEWDIERCLQTGASSLLLVSALRRMVGRSSFLIALAVPAFLLQHALQGWCPPMALFRRLGFRTRFEIDEERFALKAVRGDFNDINQNRAEPPQAKAKRATKSARSS